MALPPSSVRAPSSGFHPLFQGSGCDSTGCHTGTTSMLVFPLQRPFTDKTLSRPHQGWIDGGLVGKLCPTLCNLMDCSPPGSSVHGIPQARIL